MEGGFWLIKLLEIFCFAYRGLFWTFQYNELSPELLHSQEMQVFLVVLQLAGPFLN